MRDPSAPKATTAPAAQLPVAVVVVAWNSESVLGGCLRSALAQNPAEIVVVDNASTDGSLSRWREIFPSVRFIPMAVNVGFAQGCNVGVACTRAPYVLFLNDDAELQPGYLPTLLQALESRPALASATGKLVCVSRNAQTIDSAGIELGAHALRPLDRGHGEPDLGQYDAPEDIFGPSGAAALFRRSAFDALGATDGEPFDAKLFAYYEDVDLAWRLNRQGWHHAYVPAAIAHHGRRGPGNKPLAISVRAFTNRYRVWRKNESLGRFLQYAPLAIPWEVARLVRLGRKNPRLLGHIIKDLPNAFFS